MRHVDEALFTRQAIRVYGGNENHRGRYELARDLQAQWRARQPRRQPSAAQAIYRPCHDVPASACAEWQADRARHWKARRGDAVPLWLVDKPEPQEDPKERDRGTRGAVPWLADKEGAWARILAKTTRQGEHLLWEGTVNSAGKPVMSIADAMTTVARVAWMAQRRNLVSGQTVRKECDERLCVAPEHHRATRGRYLQGHP